MESIGEQYPEKSIDNKIDMQLLYIYNKHYARGDIVKIILNSNL